MHVELNVEHIVETAVEQVFARHNGLDDQFAYTEPHAARLLGMTTFQLGDLRRAGRISFCRIGPQTIRYRREHLLEFLESHEVQAKGA